MSFRAAISLLFLTLLVTAVSGSPSRAQSPLPPFGDLVVIPPPDNDIRSVSLVLSGDDGWTPQLDAFAKKLADLDTLVVGINLSSLKAALAADANAQCFDFGADLVRLARAVEANAGINGYIQPMLIGWASGASFAYAALNQAPQDTFKGVISIGFCAKADFPKPLCPSGQIADAAKPEEGKLRFEAVDKAPAPWTVIDGVAPACQTIPGDQFVDGMDGALAVTSPAGATVDGWFETFSDAYLPIAGADFSFRAAPSAARGDLKDMPLIEIKDPKAPPSDTLVIFFSGDGGWADIDDEVSHRLAAQGLPVIGISSLRYFWTERTPDDIAADTARIFAHYARAWGKQRFLLAGYSFGADVVPFVATRLKRELPTPFTGLALLAPSRSASFIFHISGWVGGNAGIARTKPETDKLTNLPIVCVYGTEEEGSLCPPLSAPNVFKTAIKGDHHFGEDYDAVARAILELREAVARK